MKNIFGIDSKIKIRFFYGRTKLTTRVLVPFLCGNQDFLKNINIKLGTY